MGRKLGEVPVRLAGVQQRFSAWRRARTRGQRIPERLWKAAAQLASEFGVNRTAKLLKVDYYHLKKHLDRHAASSKASPSFLELPPVSFSPASECVIEFEDALGASMRVHLKGTEMPDLLSTGPQLLGRVGHVADHATDEDPGRGRAGRLP